MVYEIRLRSDISVPIEIDIREEKFENPREVQKVIGWLKKCDPNIDFVIVRDDIQLTVKDFNDDLKSYEIQIDREEDCLLRPGFRKGYGTQSDISEGPDGVTKVYKPPNPEGNYD